MRKLLAALALPAVMMAAGPPVSLIFDTDMGNDVDDALALAMIHALESRGEARLLAVTVTKDNRCAAPFVDLVDTFYGRGEIPVGVVHNGKTPNDRPMICGPVERKRPDGSYVYPRRLLDFREAPEAVSLLRQVLASQKDGSVTIVQVGFSTNLARLLEADRALVARKVRLLSVMAGAFPEGKPEYNVKTDIPAAKKLFAEWPTPIVASGYEVGLSILYPATSIEKDFAYTADHPVAEAYRLHSRMPYNRPTWDLTAVLYAVRPEGYFSLSPRGTISVDEEGRTHFTPQSAGRHRYLTVDAAQRARALEAMITLASQRPGH